ncbi:MAG TPA: sugar phosphate isomerase/epimerase [Paenibacillus sp.]|uniref:sugar phosphate isomerase/epimerase family protein n=1 Tax=Paenibacillus sp. TaxID=58172 RepID=UPI002C1C79A7|nr:sugar phosphate isomerase/epimerase [Paenibacillus sp.]HUC94297.1 sugar phosphate isomerase/epimerase [Paenibacillus sp.]
MSFNIGTRIPPKISKTGIENVAKWAAEIGLDVLDVPNAGPEVKQACDAAGIGIGSVDAIIPALLSKDDNERGEAFEKVKATMTEMNQAGASVLFMCLFPADKNQSRDESFAIWKDIFPKLVKHAEKNGIYIAIEGWPGPAPTYPTIGCTPEMWRAMFEAIPSKHFGLNYDPSHLVRLGIDYMRALHEFSDRINHVHGKDTEMLSEELYESGILPATFGSKYDFSEGSWRYTIPGHGTVEWSKVAVVLDRIGYKGAISIELEDHRFWGSLEAEQQGIIKAKKYLETYFK